MVGRTAIPFTETRTLEQKCIINMQDNYGLLNKPAFFFEWVVWRTCRTPLLLNLQSTSTLQWIHLQRLARPANFQSASEKCDEQFSEALEQRQLSSYNFGFVCFLKSASIITQSSFLIHDSSLWYTRIFLICIAAAPLVPPCLVFKMFQWQLVWWRAQNARATWTNSRSLSKHAKGIWESLDRSIFSGADKIQKRFRPVVRENCSYR